MAPRFHYFVARLTSSFGLKEVESLTAPPSFLAKNCFRRVKFPPRRCLNRVGKPEAADKFKIWQTALELNPDLRFFNRVDDFSSILAGDARAVRCPHHFLESIENFLIACQSHHLSNQSSNREVLDVFRGHSK
jgi:hypothetical protein